MPEVRRTTEFERVASLPRRRVTHDDAAAWAEVFTAELRRPGGTRRLNPYQGIAIAEAVQNGGLLGGLPVGTGKMDLNWCLPVAMKSRQSVLIVPAANEEATRFEFTKLLGQWRSGVTPPQIVTPNKLALPGSKDLLFNLDPDLIIIDESDELQNRKASVCRRIDRYVVAKQSAVRVCAYTGSLSRKSIMGYWHHLLWALRERAPVPRTDAEAEEWALALDDFGLRAFSSRFGPGPLGATLAQARAWFSARLAETPGVLTVDEDSAAAVPLTFSLEPAREDRVLDGHYRTFLELGENPAGIPVTDPLSRWRTDGLLGTGVFYRYVKPPPEPWRDALRGFAKFCRRKIDDSTRTSEPLDTEAQVVRRYPHEEAVETWLDVRDTFEPITEAVRLSDSVVLSALAWLARENTPAVVWCGSVEIGQWISQVGKLPYYGREGRDAASGRALHNADPTRSMVCSWNANKRGFNLQAWRRALIVHPPQSAKYVEQIVGRHHRQGQTEPVRVTVLCTSGGTYDAFDAAMSEASFARATVGMTQKILRAEVVRAHPKVTSSNEFRWARKKREKE